MLVCETITRAYDARGRLAKVERSGTVDDKAKAEHNYAKADNRTNVNVTGGPSRRPERLVERRIRSPGGREDMLPTRKRTPRGYFAEAASHSRAGSGAALPSRCFMILPADVRGKSSTKMKLFGTL